MRDITIALAKGRLAMQTLDLLEESGISCEEIRDKETRKLIFVNHELGIRFFLSKTSDVPTYVEYGAADIGVVGSDTILEECRKVLEVLDLDLGKCNMCVAGPASALDALSTNRIRRVATKYPNIAREYFFENKHQTVEIVKLNGSVELAPLTGLAEVIVDIVESGRTLYENGLDVLETVAHISARLVVNRVSMKMKEDEIKPMIAKLKKILAEEAQE